MPQIKTGSKTVWSEQRDACVPESGMRLEACVCGAACGCPTIFSVVSQALARVFMFGIYPAIIIGFDFTFYIWLLVFFGFPVAVLLQGDSQGLTGHLQWPPFQGHPRATSSLQGLLWASLQGTPF